MNICTYKCIDVGFILTCASRRAWVCVSFRWSDGYITEGGFCPYSPTDLQQAPLPLPVLCGPRGLSGVRDQTGSGAPALAG